MKASSTERLVTAVLLRKALPVTHMMGSAICLLVASTTLRKQSRCKSSTIAIPVSIAHNYFVSRIDSLVIDMEESAQKMIDALYAMEATKAS